MSDLHLLEREGTKAHTLLPVLISGPGMSWYGPITSFIICRHCMLSKEPHVNLNSIMTQNQVSEV